VDKKISKLIAVALLVCFAAVIGSCGVKDAVEDVQEGVEGIQGGVQDIQGGVQNVNDNIQDIMDTMQAGFGDNASLQEMLASATAELKELQTEKVNLEAEINILRAAKAELETENIALKIAIQANEKTISDLQSEVFYQTNSAMEYKAEYERQKTTSLILLISAILTFIFGGIIGMGIHTTGIPAKLQRYAKKFARNKPPKTNCGAEEDDNDGS
jgi:chromosome segregation ATPase